MCKISSHCDQSISLEAVFIDDDDDDASDNNDNNGR